jgi:hypothetical protein
MHTRDFEVEWVTYVEIQVSSKNFGANYSTIFGQNKILVTHNL